MKTFKQAIVLPPKINFYQPAIFGFKIIGKKGSIYHKSTGWVRKIVDDFNFKSENRPPRLESGSVR